MGAPVSRLSNCCETIRPVAPSATSGRFIGGQAVPGWQRRRGCILRDGSGRTQRLPAPPARGAATRRRRPGAPGHGGARPACGARRSRRSRTSRRTSTPASSRGGLPALGRDHRRAGPRAAPDPDERDHLYSLAGHTPPPRAFRTDHASPGLLRVLGLLDTPAMIISDLRVTLRQNRSPRRSWACGPTTGPTAQHYLPLVHRSRSRLIHPGQITRCTRAGTWRRCVPCTAAPRGPRGAGAGRAPAGREPGVRRAVGAPRGGAPGRQAEALCSPARRPNHARLPEPHRREPHRKARRVHRGPGSEDSDRLALLSVVGNQRMASLA